MVVATLLNIFLLKVNSDRSTIGLHLPLISSLGIRPRMTCWALGLCPGTLDCPRRSKQLLKASSESLINEKRIEGDPRRNSSSDMMNAAQACIPATKVILQKALAIGTCLMNVQEGRKLKISKGKLLPSH